MNNNQFLRHAEINEIVSRLIFDFNLVSLCKVVITAFSVANSKLHFETSRKEFGLIANIFETFSLGLQTDSDDLRAIFECIRLLEERKYILVKNNEILVLKRKECSQTNPILCSQIFKKTIAEIEKFSDKSFIKGVIESV